jgi:hypothetical protein
MVPVGFGLLRGSQPSSCRCYRGRHRRRQPATRGGLRHTAHNTALALPSAAAPRACVCLATPAVSVTTDAAPSRFALRDLRRSAIAPRPPRPDDWESRMHGRPAGRLTRQKERSWPSFGHVLSGQRTGSGVRRAALLRRPA